MSGTHWFKNAIVYHILIDRFAGYKDPKDWEKPDFLGGNIQGIIEKLPYLIDLGIDVIWISPFYKTSAYHGYHITDFFQVDPHFGTIEDLKSLIQKCHNSNLRIIADFVPNHLSKKHPFFIDAQTFKESKYNNWFYFTNWPHEYLSFLSVDEIPKINLNNPEARRHIIEAAKFWLSQGFDGFRVDHIIGPSHEFWNEFKQQIKSEFSHALLIGEAWMMGIKFYELKTINVKGKYIKWLISDASDSLFKEYVGELDGVLDFKFQHLIRKYIINSELTEKIFNKKLHQHFSCFPDNYYLPNFLDNHDMDRFLFLSKNNSKKLKEAATIQFKLNQPSIIYYGTETGLTQNKSVWQSTSHGDLQARQPMNWEQQNKDLLAFYKKIIKEKKNRK